MRRIPSPTPEAIVLHDVRLALARVPGLVLWRNSVGMATIDGRRQPFGLARGSSDLIGIWCRRGVGVFVAIEVKSPNGRVSEAQARFLSLVRSHGGIAAVVRSVSEATALFVEEDSHGVNGSNEETQGNEALDADGLPPGVR